MELKWSEPATGDLEGIERYIGSSKSPAVGIDVVLKIIDAVAAVLPAHPEAGRAGRFRGARELVIVGIPYIVVYRLRKAERRVEILRVLHDSQDWPHWL